MKKAILISCFDWYEARLKPIKEILENEYNVSILTSDFEHISKNRIKNRIDACEYIHVPSYKKNVSIKRIFSHIVFGKKVGKRINKICPDLIYLLLPPNNIARYCLDYKKKHPEVKYIVDIIDMWPESMPIHRLENTIPYKYWTNFRNQSIQQADVVMTECELYQEKLLKDIPRDYKVLYLYKNENGLTDEQVDEVLNTMSYHGRRAASMNPNAMLRTPFEEIAKEFGYSDPMEYLRSPFNPKTTQYLRVTGNAPSADGAACVIVCPTEMAHKFRQKPIEVLGVGASALELMRPHNEKEITKEAARQVYEMTGLTPADIDLLFVNDFVLASQLCAAEEVGYLPKGEGWKWVLEGRTAFDGDRPINPHGGRTSYGHAYGASGMADVYEAVLQLRGQAGDIQVKNNPKTAMLRGYGGGQNCRIPILRTVD